MFYRVTSLKKISNSATAAISKVSIQNKGNPTEIYANSWY